MRYKPDPDKREVQYRQAVSSVQVKISWKISFCWNFGCSARRVLFGTQEFLRQYLQWKTWQT